MAHCLINNIKSCLIRFYRTKFDQFYRKNFIGTKDIPTIKLEYKLPHELKTKVLKIL